MGRVAPSSGVTMRATGSRLSASVCAWASSARRSSASALRSLVRVLNSSTVCWLSTSWSSSSTLSCSAVASALTVDSRVATAPDSSNSAAATSARRLSLSVRMARASSRSRTPPNSRKTKPAAAASSSISKNKIVAVADRFMISGRTGIDAAHGRGRFHHLRCYPTRGQMAIAVHGKALP